ncbi:MAG: hypothetical protein Q4F95_00850 [Oscillospiraceae bacterium]|nr:hypothetical protein [Oscillospiraceae bacterium]
MFSNASCTIYHRGYDSTTRMDKWTKVQIPDVYIETTKAAKLTREGWADNCNMFASIPNTDVTVCEQDILVKGIVEHEISGSFTISDLHKQYETYTVISVDVYNFGGNPHIEIRGK